VVALRDDTFYGNIVVDAGGRTISIDSRPSDALAIAVRAHVPILVSRTVMDIAGIVPEEDLQEGGEELGEQPRRSETPPAEAEGEERLSVFQDFLKNLDIDDLDEEEGDESED
jgi:uncharacterized protein